jgi:acyl-CoA thioester hydrolase
MHVDRLERRLSHADVDFLGELKVAALLGLLEQAAVEASTAAGYDAARYTREGRLWIIHRTQLQRLVPVGGTDTVTVETQVIDFRRVRSLRRYTIRRDEDTAVEALTDWVYCDMRTGRPMRIPQELQHAFAGLKGAPPHSRSMALPDSNGHRPVDFQVTVQPSHLDHIAHVNNAVYANYLEDGACALFAERGWPLRRMLEHGGALRLVSLDFEYCTDALLGDALTIRSWMDEEWTCTAEGTPKAVTVCQTITRGDGKDIMRARSTWAWRQKPAIIGGVPRP